MKKLVAFLCLVAIAIAMSARKVVWVIDPGHGGRDTGCEGTISKEKDITLAIAKEVGRLVKQNIKDVRVVYTREKDKYPTLPDRCDLANSKGAQLFISIHVNDAPNRFAAGTESYFATNVPQSGANVGKSELLALLLQRQYLANGRGVSRGVKQEAWYVCEHTNMPSVLTEVGFISNLEEEAFMNSKEGQAILAKSIYEALAEWKKQTDAGLDKRTLRNLRYAYFDPRNEPKTTPQVTIIKQQDSSKDLAQATKETSKDKAKTPDAQPSSAQVQQSMPQAAENSAANVASAEKDASKQNTSEKDSPKQNTSAMDASKQTIQPSDKDVQNGTPTGSDAAAKPAIEKKAAAPTPSVERKKDAEPKTTKSEAEKKPTVATSSAERKKETDSKATTAPPAKNETSPAGESKGVVKPVYSIQIMTLSAIIKADDYRLKGETNIRFVQVDDRYKLLIGSASTYKEAKNLLAQVREKFPDAFIVAYVGDRQVTTAEAMKLE